MKLEYTTQVAGKKYVMRAHRAGRHWWPIWTVRSGRRRVAVFSWNFGSGDGFGVDARDHDATNRLTLSARSDMAELEEREYFEAMHRAVARHS